MVSQLRSCSGPDLLRDAVAGGVVCVRSLAGGTLVSERDRGEDGEGHEDDGADAGDDVQPAGECSRAASSSSEAGPTGSCPATVVAAAMVSRAAWAASGVTLEGTMPAICWR